MNLRHEIYQTNTVSWPSLTERGGIYRKYFYYCDTCHARVASSREPLVEPKGHKVRYEIG